MRPVFWLLQALRGMGRGPLIQLAATGSVAVGLLLVGMAVLGTSNLSRLTEKWGRGIQIVAYLKPDVTETHTASLARMLGSRPEVLTARLVSSREAHQRLADSLGTRRSLLQDLESGFLPSSFEISLAEDRPDQVQALLALLSTAPGVEEVDYMGAWARRLGTLAGLLKIGSLALAMLMSLACLYIVASTIRLGVHARREEIEITKLMGATDSFVRAPFLIEGLLQGLAGAGLAAALLYGLYRTAAPRLEELLASTAARLELSFLAPTELVVGLLCGAVLGLLGSRLALASYLEV